MHHTTHSKPNHVYVSRHRAGLRNGFVPQRRTDRSLFAVRVRVRVQRLSGGRLENDHSHDKEHRTFREIRLRPRRRLVREIGRGEFPRCTFFTRLNRTEHGSVVRQNWWCWCCENNCTVTFVYAKHFTFYKFRCT